MTSIVRVDVTDASRESDVVASKGGSTTGLLPEAQIASTANVTSSYYSATAGLISSHRKPWTC